MTNNYSKRGKLITGLRHWWLMLTGIFLLALTVGTRSVNAQSITNYAFSASGGTFTSIVGSPGAVNVPALQVDDASSGLIPIGFNFVYMGVSYSSLWANSNGFLGFGATIPAGATYNPGLSGGGGAGRPIIAPLWDDMAGSTGTATYVTTGLPGSRVFTIEWLNWNWTWNGPVAVSFQAKLYETTGVVQFIYQPGATAPTSPSASIGITAVGTGTGNFLSLSSAGTAPTVSSTTETSTIAASPASGQTYTFTPPLVTLPPSNLTFSGVTPTGMTLNWTDGVGETGYLIQRSTDGVNYTTVASVAANTTSYTESGLFSNTLFYWNVVGFTEGGTSTPASGSQSTAAGTICGTFSVGPTGTYSTLTAALADIRSNGLACPVILELQSAYVSTSETFPIWTGLLGSGPSTPVTIRPETGAAGLSITSANTWTTILDSLTQFVTIDGRPGGVGASELTVQNTAFTGSAMRLVQESSNNNFRFINFRGQNNTTTNAVVFMGGSTVAGGSGNDNNTFNECNFRDNATLQPANGFLAAGNTTGSVNDNNAITNCRVFNFFSPGLATVGISLTGLNNNWTITGNRIYQEATRTYTAANTHKAINANNSTGTFNISNNTIGYTSASGTGTYTMTFASAAAFATRFFAIDVNCAATPASTISGNQIANISLSTSSGGTGSSAVFCGIWLNAGNATINGNTIGSLSATDNILVRSTTTSGTATTATVIGIGQGAATAGSIVISNNNIGGLGFNGITTTFTPSTTVGATIAGIFNQGTTTLADANSFRTISGNTIGGTVAASLRAGNANQITTTMSANFSVIGILNTGATRINILNNTIQNFEIPTRSTAGVMYGTHSTTGIPIITGNIIRNFFSSSKNIGTTTAATIIGLSVSSTSIPVAGTSVNIGGNQVYNLNSRADSSGITISGISYSGSATAGFSYLIQKNLVYNLQDITAPAGAGDVALQTINGIAIQGGIPTVQNNMIRLGIGTNISHTYNGILKNVAQTVAPINIWHNSVYIGGTSTVNFAVTPAVSAAFRRSLASTSQQDDIRNNIFANVRTSAIANQFNYGIALNGNTFLNLTKNIYFADTLNNGRTGITGATIATGLAAWKTASGADAASIYENPQFLDPISATPDLHLQAPPALVPSEQAGVLIAGVTDDYDGQTRSGLSPVDIGADAGNYLPSADFLSPTIYSVTNSNTAGQCTAIARTITAVANDGSGLGSVVINWSLNGVAQTAIPMTNVSDSTWTGTIPASGAALVAFSVTATDASVNLNATTSASQSYRDQYLSAGLSAGADQTICPGASTNLSVASPFLNSIVFSEVSGFETGTGFATPASGISGFDYIELTNIGNQPVNISGWRLEITGSTPGVYIIPAGNTVPAGGTFTLARTGGGAAIPGYYVNSTLLSVGSATSQGLIISDLSGNISDVVAINGGTPFNPVGTGTPAVTAAMWSGNIASSSGTAGIRRTSFSDSNSAADWTVASASNLTNWGTFNAGLGTINVANISWSSGGTGSVENVTPVSAPTNYIVTINDGICTASDTVTVNWFTTLPAPVAYDSTHCGNQQALCDVGSVPGAIAYRWYTTPTGGTPIQNLPDTNLLQNVAITTTFYVAAFDGVCEGPRVAVTETVTQPDVVDITITPNDSICLGASATLDAVSLNPNYTYLWAGSGVGSLNTNSGAQVISTPTAAGSLTFIVIATDAGAGCVATDTLVLNVFNNPVVTVTPATASICESESVTTSTLAYSFDGAAGAPTGYAASNATITADEDINGVTIGSLNNTQAAPNCATYTDFTALPAPALAPGTTYPITISITDCELTGFFSAGTAVYIDWNRDGDFADAGELAYTNNTTINGPHIVNGSVTVPLTASAGLTRMRVVTTENAAIPVATGTYGYGETEDYLVLIASQTGLTFSWSPAAGVSDPSIASPVITPVNTGLTSYVLTVTTANGCSATDNVDITVAPAPVAPTATNSTQCGAKVPAAAVSNTGAASYFWYDAPTGGNLLQADPSLTYLSSISATTNFYVAAFDGTCYSTPRTLVTATVTPVPYNVQLTASDSSLCEGSNNITLADVNASTFYNSFTWSVNAGGNVNNINSATTTATPGSAGTYNYILTATDGNCTSTDTVTVIVFANPTITSYTISDSTLCEGASASLAGAGIPASVVSGPQTPPTGYAASAATSTIDEDINGVTIGTLNNIQSAPNCATYTNYTSLPAPTLLAGTNYPITISITDCELAGFFSAGTAVYIDYNRDGDFADAGELAYTNNTTINGPHIVNGSITIPVTASPGVTRMRVVNTEGSLVPLATGTYGYGETEDYNVNIISYNLASIQYSWSGAGAFSAPTSSSTTFTPSGTGTVPVTLTVTDLETGCVSSQSKNVSVTPLPAAPTTNSPITRCGPGDVTATATGSGGTLFWTGPNGGNILSLAGSLTQSVTTSGVFDVREFPSNLDTTAVGYNPITNPSAPVGYFPTTSQGMWFRVNNTGGTIIKSVDIYPNGPIGTPYGIAIIDSLGNTIGSVSGVTTVTAPNFETVQLNIYVPFSTTPYAMRPTSSPNLSVHQNATVQATAPWQIPGEITILAYGNMPPAASFFGNTTFGMFYNWQVMHGCFGNEAVVNYTVNPAPALAITPSGPTTFCGSGTLTLDAGAAPTDPSYVNFSWSPATGLNTTTGAVVTANVSSTTTYTVTADDGVSGPTGCVNTATVTVTVNTAPFADAGIVPDTLCAGDPFTFNGSGGSASYKFVGTTQNLGQTAGWPFNGANASQRMQVYVSAAELNAAGLFGPSFINSIGFNVVSKLSSQPYSNFTVAIDEIVGGCFSSANYIVIPGANTVYTGNYTTTTGWNDIVFQTPYAWDGVSDLVIQTCFTNTTNTLFDIVYTSRTLGCNSVNALNAAACGAITGALSEFRPNMRFQGGSVNFSWTPVTELSSASVANPTFTASLGTGPRQYVLTVTDPVSGCTATDTANFFVNNAPVAPSIAFDGADTTVCVSGSVNMSATVVDGSFQWQISGDNVTFTDIPGATTTTLATPVITSTSWFRLKAFCVDSSYSNVLQAVVFTPQVTFTEGDTVCGQGNVTLNATANPGYFIQWFADSASSAPLANSNSYNTFVTQTDTFWVRATVDTNSVFGGGPAPSYCAVTNAGSACITNVTFGSLNYTSAACESTSGTNYNIIPEGTATAQVILGQTYNLSVNCDGAAITSVWIDYNRDGVYDASEWQQIYTSATAGTIAVTIPVTAQGGKTGMRIRSRLSGNANGAGDACLAMGSGETEDFTITIGSSACSSVKVPVIAVVNSAPAVAVTPGAATICEGSSVNLNVTTGTGDYTNFNWAPATGLNTTSGASVVATPSVTTSYIVTASGNVNGCQNSDTVVVTVNPAPVFSVSTTTPSLCGGDTAKASVVVTSPVPSNYNVTSIPFSPVAPSGPVTVLVDAGVAVVPQTIASLDDGTWEGISLPAGFAFSYYGAAQTQFNVSTNAFITLGSTLGTAGCCSGQIMPSTTTPNNLLALAHEDYNFATSGTIDYFTTGTAPFRKFVVRFTNVPRFGGTGAPTTGQIVLNETLNTIEYHVTSVTTAAGDNTTMGIENSTGTLATVVTGRNSTSPWTATNEGWSFQLPLAATIQWSGANIIGSTTGTSINALPTTSGYYTVVVTNPLTGCTKADSVLINAGVNPQPVIVTNDTTLCAPNEIYVKVADAGPYSGGYPSGTTFAWFDATGGIIVPATPDLDSISSTNSSSFFVVVTLPSQCSGISDTAFIVTKAVSVVPTINNATCSAGGSILATVTSGTAPFQYVWSTDAAQTNVIQTTTTSSTTDLLSNLAAGTYYLSVSDEFGLPTGCSSGVIPFTVAGASQIVISVDAQTNVTCNGQADGSVTISYTGGVAPYSVLWSNSATTTSIAGLSAGTYTVTVSDLSGCADTLAVVITEPLPISVTLSSTPESAPGANDGTATAVVSGGTPGYTIDWYDLVPTLITSGPTATGLTGGFYQTFVADANGCFEIDTVEVTTITNVTLNLTMLFEGMYDGAGGLVPALLNSGVGVSPTECDTILVELRDQISTTTVLASGTAVLGTNGQASFTFPGSVNGATGYIAVFHRNAVQTWSDLVTFSSTTNYNFTTAATQAFGGNQKEVAPGVWAFYSGDIAPQDEVVDIFDVIPMDNDVINFAFGYVPTDLTGDGVVDIFDVIVLDNNVINFAASVHP